MRLIIMHNRNEAVVALRKKGAGAVTASDIELTDDIELVDPAHHIATLSKDTDFDMELTIRRGRGYETAESRLNNTDESRAVGVIHLDASFSPINKNALWLEKTHAKLHRGQDRLSHASAHAQTLLQQSAQRGHVIKTTVRLLNQLLDDYGRDELHVALGEALDRQSPYPEAVQHVLERRRDEQHLPPPLAVAVPAKVKHYSVKLARLADYDKLNGTRSETGDDTDD